MADPDEAHLAYIRINQWMHAVELQVCRCLGPTTSPQRDGDETYRLDCNARQRDIDYFVIALHRLRRTADAAKGRIRDARIKQALKTFDQACPDLVELRDVAEHLDKYDRGLGRLLKQGRLDNTSPTYSWGEDDAGLTFRGLSMSVVDGRSAARRLHSRVMDVLADLGSPLKTSEWPLVIWPGTYE